MKHINRYIIFLGIILISISSYSQETKEYVIVTNQNMDLTSLTERKLKAIFLGEITLWKSKTKLHPCYLNKPILYQQFFSETIKMSQSQFNKYWLKRVFSGYGTPPRSYGTIEQLITYINRNKGAMAVIPIEESLDLKGVKILNIEEK
jgi:hypothetical protein